eukprot:2960186-Amphidinium_carterae.1
MTNGDTTANSSLRRCPCGSRGCPHVPCNRGCCLRCYGGTRGSGPNLMSGTQRFRRKERLLLSERCGTYMSRWTGYG